MLGRLFVELDYGPGGVPVALVSFRCWSERFGSTPEIIGRGISLDGSTRTVVGVLPRGFDFPEGACVWVPKK
jgi:putative ABC transport system permease protein